MKFQVDSSSNLKYEAFTNIQSENYKRAISQQIRMTELWFLCTALLHNVFYQCMKAQVDTFQNLKVMAQKKIQTENKQRAVTNEKVEEL